MKEKLPAAFLESIERLLGESAPRFLDALGEEARSGLRLNPQKIRIDELQGELKAATSPVAWEPAGYEAAASGSLGKHPFHAAGLYYLQEPSAMAPVSVLDPQPGERILDLCAAPGGKTTQISDRMKDEGILVANDPNPRRVQALARNIERWGARNVSITNDTPSRLSEHFGAYFDRVLVDAPCSGEGTFRAHPHEIKKWSPKFIQRCAAIQDEILYYAAGLVRPGGILVYSTCTFNQEENEGTIERFLDQTPAYSLQAILTKPGFSPGIPLAKTHGRKLQRAVRIWPHLAPGEGHFIACLKRDNGSAGPEIQNNQLQVSPERDLIEQYRDFFDQTLVLNTNTMKIKPDSPSLRVFGSYLYALPADAPPLTGLKVIHWGFWLGEFRAGGFIPSPALAVSVGVKDAQKVIEFSVDDPLLDAYLRGSPVSLPMGQEELSGWVLVSCANHAVGWGKVQGNRVKSQIPSWLRRN